MQGQKMNAIGLKTACQQQQFMQTPCSSSSRARKSLQQASMQLHGVTLQHPANQCQQVLGRRGLQCSKLAQLSGEHIHEGSLQSTVVTAVYLVQSCAWSAARGQKQHVPMFNTIALSHLAILTVPSCAC